MHPDVIPYSAIESNNSRLKEGKHVIGNVLEDLLSGAPIPEGTAVERIMTASRQFMASAQAIATMASSNSGQMLTSFRTKI